MAPQMVLPMSLNAPMVEPVSGGCTFMKGEIPSPLEVIQQLKIGCNKALPFPSSSASQRCLSHLRGRPVVPSWDI
jgi:hypothetical protein